MSEESRQELIVKMDILVETINVTNRVLGILAISNLEMMKEKSLVLLRCGFRPKEVANILDIPIGSVTKARSRATGRTKH